MPISRSAAVRRGLAAKARCSAWANEIDRSALSAASTGIVTTSNAHIRRKATPSLYIIQPEKRKDSDAARPLAATTSRSNVWGVAGGGGGGGGGGSPPNPTITYVATSKAVSTRRKADARVARLWAAVCLIGLGISNFVAQHYYDSAPESGCNARAFAGKPRRRHWISRYCGRNSSS